VSSASAKTPEVKPDAPVIQMPERYNPAVHDWGTLIEGADTVLGADLVSGTENWELFDALQGVPFMITRVVYRPSDFGGATEANYVSCEAVLAPASILVRKHVDLSTLPFDPGGMVIFNDGSTGIARQITEYLHAAGYIVVVPDGTDLQPGGKKGESSFDLPVSKWAHIRAGDMRFGPDGQPAYSADVRLNCPRGIRISEGYENAYTKDGKTRYLA
jgi:hypothetical protein